MEGTERIIAVYDDTTQQWSFLGDRRDKNSTLLHYTTGALIPSEVKRIAQSKDGRLWFCDDLQTRLSYRI
jgi:hypothetical protein